MQEQKLLFAPKLSPFHPAELKSALQKYMRRGEVEKATGAAAGMLASGVEGWVGLAKRIPMILVEDMGWEWMGRVYQVAKNWPLGKTGHKPEHERQMLEVVANLATVPHTKEAGWLFGMGLEGLKKAQWYTPVALEKAINEGNYEESVRLCMAAHKERNFLQYHGLVRVITKAAEGAPPLAQQVVEGALWRLRKGGMEGDECMLICTCVMAILDRLEKEPLEWPAVQIKRPPEPIAVLDWYGLDGHTYRGKAALHKVAQKHGLETGHLSELMFFYESIKMNPERKARWKEESLEYVAHDLGYRSFAAGGEVWDKVKPEVQALLEESIRNTLEGK